MHMNWLEKNLIWHAMLSKRLFKKWTFVVLLVSIPILVWSVGHMTKEKSGMLSIGILQEEKGDLYTQALLDRLLTKQHIVAFYLVEEEEELYEKVTAGELDGGWIFTKDLEEKIDRYARRRLGDDCLVRVIEREDNVALQLAREILYGVLYPEISYAIYEAGIGEYLASLQDTDGQVLRGYYEQYKVKGDLFQYAQSSTQQVAMQQGDVHYLTAPLRGMLALMLILAGLAASMYYLQDEKNGMFQWIPIWQRRGYDYRYLFSAILVMAVAILFALKRTGIWTSLGWELLTMTVYGVSCMLFCRIVTKCCRTIPRLGAAIPILVILMLVLCPIFFDVKWLRGLQQVFPPFYYLQGVHNVFFFKRLLWYCVIAFIVDRVIK